MPTIILLYRFMLIVYTYNTLLRKKLLVLLSGIFCYHGTMIFCPLPGTPIITQGFAQNPTIYSSYGYAGHNGIDFGVPEGTTIYAPHDGLVTVQNDADTGYGLYVVITDSNRLSLLGHLQSTHLTSGQKVYQGDPIGLSGNSGTSTNPHLHWTYKLMSNGRALNQNNGFDGAIDVTEFTRLWLDQDLHYDAVYTDFAREYLVLDLPSNVYLKNPNRGVA